MEHDYGEFQDSENIGENLMARLEGLAREQLDAEALVETMELRLSEAKAALKAVKERKLPDLIEEAQLGESSIVTPNGIEIKLSTVIRGSIPKGNEAPAFQWLEDNNNGNLIKRLFVIDFGKGDEAWANKFERDLRQRKRPLNVKRSKGVHAGTLQSFVKKALEDGVNIPMDVFGVFRQKFAKVKVKG